MSEKLLDVKNLHTSFFTHLGEVQAIRDVSFGLDKGEIIGIVGESGSGKSVTSLSIMGLLAYPGRVKDGEILFNGEDLLKKKKSEMRKIQGDHIAMIFQDPMTSLNPVRTIGYQIAEVIIKHQKKSKEEAKQMAIKLMGEVGIPNPETRYDEYPFQYSGGMRQRIVIAIALACRPNILICDEPTTALDVTIQAQILKLIKDLQKEYGYTTVYITHDLGVVANVADRVAVMYAGQIIEFGNAEEIFYTPKHPYTWALLSSLPQLGIKGEPLYAITGTPPSLYDKVVGDAFAPRNPYAMKIDFEEEPPFFKVSDTHYAKTWLLDPRAPQAEPPKAIRNLHDRLIHMTDERGEYRG